MQTKHIVQSILISLALSAALTYVVNARPEPTPTFNQYGTITTKRTKPKEPGVTITITGKDGWYINTQYNAKIVVGDNQLRKADGLYKDINPKGDKALEATWLTKSMAKTGTAKLVFCNSTSCTAPVSITFDIGTK